jgi:hypothetical protein
VITWASPEDLLHEDRHTRVTFTLEPIGAVVRLTVIHDHLEPGSEMLTGITAGWPKVLSSLKTLLEVGRALPELWARPDEATPRLECGHITFLTEADDPIGDSRHYVTAQRIRRVEDVF